MWQIVHAPSMAMRRSLPPAGSRVKVARVDGPLLMVETIETDA